MPSRDIFARHCVFLGDILPHLVEGFWGGAEATLEEFYEVRDVCKTTLRADLRNGLIRGYQQHPRALQSLLHYPAMRWHTEDALKLLLERCQRTICQCCQLLNRDIPKEVLIDHIKELLIDHIGRIQ